ncbi:cytochrome P450 [Sulfolobales archaeon HS-7]|nr:cytochrome P450 [Sulfolobales archaeon HS-7]
MSYTSLGDIFNWFRIMRRENPVYFDGEVWHLFKYDDVRRALIDTSIFSSKLTNYDEKVAEELRQSEGIAGLPIYYTMLTTDPPIHDELKNITIELFSPQSLSSYEQFITKVVRALINSLGETFDFVKDFAIPLPIMVIAEMLGLPEEDRGRFKEWSDNVALMLGQGDKPLSMEKFVESMEYLSTLVKERSERKGRDLISVISNGMTGGKRLSLTEVLGYVFLLLAAGNETTTNFLTNAMIAFVENSRYHSIQPGNLTLALEEVLRYHPPVRRTTRIVKDDISIRGLTLRRGDYVKVWIASANRDEEVFPNSEEFEAFRKPNPHLSFGGGTHMCLGASLARLEARIAFEELIREFDDFSIKEIGKPIPSEILNGYSSLIMKGRKKNGV